MGAQKIAIFTHGIRRGPFARLATTLAKGFAKLGVDCEVVVLNATEEERAKYPEVKVHSLGAPKATFSLLPLVNYLKTAQPDVVFSMPWYFNVIAIWAKRLAKVNTKIIIGEHNIFSLESKIEHGNKPQIKLLPWLMRVSYPYSQGLVAVSQDTITDLFQELKVSSKIPTKVIQNPIDPPYIQKLSQEAIAHPWFQDQSIPVILTVARLAKQKQLDVLIRAFAQVKQTVPARLLILGDGLLQEELEALCQELGVADDVDMPGYTPNPYPYMAACAFFVLASAWEGCPISLEEALACGAATLVTDGPGGAKDIVGHGKFGAVVPTGDVEALAKMMERLLSDSEFRRGYQRHAHSRAQDFNYLRITEQYLDFCNSV